MASRYVAKRPPFLKENMTSGAMAKACLGPAQAMASEAKSQYEQTRRKGYYQPGLWHDDKKVTYRTTLHTEVVTFAGGPRVVAYGGVTASAENYAFYAEFGTIEIIATHAMEGMVGS